MTAPIERMALTADEVEAIAWLHQYADRYAHGPAEIARRDLAALLAGAHPEHRGTTVIGKVWLRYMADVVNDIDVADHALTVHALIETLQWMGVGMGISAARWLATHTPGGDA